MTSPEAFFALVDHHVTGPMTDADYAKIGEYDEVTDAARGVPLVATRWPWPACLRWVGFLSRRSPKRPTERALRVGFEGSGDDEKWLSYFPDTDELDLRDWSHELEAHADWDVWNDHAVPTTEDLERRLRVLGAAMRRRPPRG